MTTEKGKPGIGCFHTKTITTLNNGYLGSRNDEERSEMRYVMRIAEFRESSNLWTQMALLGSPGSTLLWVSFLISNLTLFWVPGLEIESPAALSASLFKYVEVVRIPINVVNRTWICIGSGALRTFFLPWVLTWIISPSCEWHLRWLVTRFRWSFVPWKPALSRLTRGSQDRNRKRTG